MTVLVKIQDSSGVEVGSFTAEDNKGLAEMAAMHGIEILVSCNTGYCGVCLCDAQGDTQTLSIDKMGEHTFDLPFDENKNPKQILACVGGIKSEYFTDEKEYVVILKKLY
jgi:2Fe-2S iron-sulfur cluster binding domain